MIGGIYNRLLHALHVAVLLMPLLLNAAGDGRGDIALSISQKDHGQFEIVLSNDTATPLWISDGIFDEEKFPVIPMHIFITFIPDDGSVVGSEPGTNYVYGWNPRINPASLHLVHEMSLEPKGMRKRGFEMSSLVEGFRRQHPEVTLERRGRYRVTAVVWILALSEKMGWVKTGELQATSEVYAGPACFVRPLPNGSPRDGD